VSALVEVAEIAEIAEHRGVSLCSMGCSFSHRDAEVERHRETQGRGAGFAVQDTSSMKWDCGWIVILAFRPALDE